MVLAFVPLYIAVASLTRATVEGARDRAARALGRAIAAHVADARASGDPDALRRTLEQHVARGEVEGLVVFRADGELVAAPANTELATIAPPTHAPIGGIVIRGRGPLVDLVIRAGDSTLVARLRFEETGEHGMPLVRLVALYMTTFGVALLTFAYFALTRVIVRPVDALVHAADRVAGGSRTLVIPRAGARELAELGASVHAMTKKLVDDEAAMRAKVEELTALTKQLRETESQLARSERMASVGRLAAGVAHEIGNPITAMMAMEDLLLDGDLPRETERDFLARMKRETERIHVVIRDLLDFARPEHPAGPSSTTPAPADVGAVVESVIALVKPQKDFKSIALVTDVPADLPAVAFSAARLTQVLLNVVLNAGGAIGSARGAGTIVVRAIRSAGRVRIEVDDDGPGVPATIRDRIFDPFMTTKDVGEGTGLGLSVCRGLVEAAGGQIGVDPSRIAGARIYVELPAA